MEILFTPSSSSILKDWPSKPTVEVSWERGCKAPGVRPCALIWLSEGVRRGAVTPGTPSLRAPPRVPRSWVDPGGGPAECAPRVRPPQPTRGASSGSPVPAPRRAPNPRGAPTSNRRTPGAARIASLPLPATITRAPRTPRPPRGQVGSQGARGPAGRPGRRRRRSPGHVPGGPGERRGERGRGRAGASGAAAAVSGLAGFTSPPQVCERPPPRRHSSSSSSSSGPGERQARNNYKRKRRVEEEEETPFTFEKPSRRRSHKRRTPADAAPSPPHRWAGRQRARRPGTAPRRPPPQNPAAGAGVRAGARGDLGHVAAGGRAAAWGALGAGGGGRSALSRRRRRGNSCSGRRGDGPRSQPVRQGSRSNPECPRPAGQPGS